MVFRPRVAAAALGVLVSVAWGPSASASVDLAIGGTASASSETYGAASRAIDGNTDGNYFPASGYATNSIFQSNNDSVQAPDGSFHYAFWQVTLGQVSSINDVNIFARTDGGEGARLNDFYVAIRNTVANTESYRLIHLDTPLSAANPSLDVSFGAPVLGDVVRIEFNHRDYLALAEVQVNGTAGLSEEAAVPEPGSLALLGASLVACVGACRRFR